MSAERREPDADVTRLLHELSRGEDDAFDRLVPAVYDELRRLARRALSHEYGRDGLRTTALVHEAYLKLARHHEVDWQGRAHFFAVAARAMRQILVERARRRGAQKRGGDAAKLSLDDVTLVPTQRPETLVALDEALTRLEALDERQSRIVEYRFFGGMTVKETAAALDVSPSTVKRDWRTAKLWLHRELGRMMRGE